MCQSCCKNNSRSFLWPTCKQCEKYNNANISYLPVQTIAAANPAITQMTFAYFNTRYVMFLYYTGLDTDIAVQHASII